MESMLILNFKSKAKEISQIKLVKKSIKGDSQAFVEIMKIYKTDLYKIAYSYVKDEGKALDIIQETTYKGLMNIKKLSEPKYFKTWITKILINVSIDYIKKESNIVYIENEQNVLTINNTISTEEKLDLYDAIDTLRYNYKTAIILKYFKDMSIEEISIHMEVPTNTVKSYLRRAKIELKQVLKEEI